VRFFEASVSDPALVGPLLARRGVAAIVRVGAPLTSRSGAPANGADGTAPAASPGASPSASAAAVEILRPNGSLPFLACLEQVEVAAGEAGWLAAVRRLGAQAARTAVVDPRDAAGIPARPSPCEARLVLRTPIRIDADVSAHGPGPSLLAVNQTWDGAWSATIDGRPAPLLRTDLALSALLVAPGAHRVALGYRDPWIARGALVSIAALVLCGALVVAASRRPLPGTP
jgi:hypothetical protein